MRDALEVVRLFRQVADVVVPQTPGIEGLQRHERVREAVWRAQATASLARHLLDALGAWRPPERPDAS